MRKRHSPSPTLTSTKPQFLVDVVMPIFGQLEGAKKSVESLPAAMGDVPYRLCLVDNGSLQKEVGEWIDSFEPMVRKVHLKSNQGFAGGVNEGAKRGSAPLIMVLTTDVTLFEGAGDKMIRVLDDPTVGLVGPMLLFPPGSQHGPPERVQHAGMCFNLQAKPFHIFIGWTPDHPKVNQQRDMQAVTGACFITRREIFTKLGGMNEIYGLGTYEDMEFCFLVRSLDRRIVFEPSARGYHAVGGSLGQSPDTSGFPLGRNESIFKANVGEYIQWDEFKFW